VNINKPTQSNIDESFIRTMADDMGIVAPKNLPMVKLTDKSTVIPKLKTEKEVEGKAREEKEKQKKTKEIETFLTKNTNKLIIGLIIFLLILGIGGFFYWWNYLQIVPVTITHFECQEDQCISIEGEGDDECQDDIDCQSVEPIIQEPIIPESLIPVDETKTIELIVDQENLLSGQLNSVINEEQATGTINRILIKIIDQEEKKYISLNDLILALNINIPENILSVIADNYTLFLYKQDEGSRLGIVIEMGESETLVQDLNDWENTIIDDLNQLLLTEDILNAHSEEFGDKIYNETYIRYMNFPTPALTLDYGIVSNNLIIATSRESMFMVIDKLLTINNEDVDGTED